MSTFGIALSVIVLLGVMSMTSAFPRPNYGRFRTHEAQAIRPPIRPLHEAREQQTVRVALPDLQKCEADYEKCEAAGVPVRQCIQFYYFCVGLPFQ